MRRNTSRLSIILSLVLHAVLALLIWLQPKFLLPTHRSTQIELVDAADVLKQLQQQQLKDQTKGQIVDQSEKAINDDVPVDSKYLSRHNQVVVRETRAATNGKFENTTATGGKAMPEKQTGKLEKQASEQDQKKEVLPRRKLLTNSDGLKSLPSWKDLNPSFKISPRAENFASGGGEGPSASDDHLDKPVGMQTLLSTREFVYFAYYSRIKDKLRQYWEPKIKEKMEAVMRQGRSIASTGEKVTKVVIVLDSKGTLVKVQILGASGVSDLDDAAVEAFKAAAPFPNPPKGIVEEDGTVKINWDFILEA